MSAADFDPEIDFGRLERRTPAEVLRPGTAGELAACMAELRDRGVPYKIRGAAHTAGGQVLSDGGAVIETRRLGAIREVGGERIAAGGGATWLAVVDHLATAGRRPLALTDQLRTTVAGTLSVGGFCDTSHLHGPQINTVTELAVITPDGARHRVGPGDELFDFALAGLGQLGAIAEATVRTEARPPTIALRLLRWPDVGAFARDATLIGVYRLYDYLRARVIWHPGDGGCYVDATAGNFAAEIPDRDPALAIIKPELASDFELHDLVARLREDDLDGWTWASAVLELVLPLPGALEWWPEIDARIRAAGIPAHFRRGAGAMVVPCAPRLPMAPLPDSPHALVLALRPGGTTEVARGLVEALRELGRFAVGRGARLYRIGVEDRDPSELGAALPRLLELKRELDPDNLCNPGLLDELL